MVVVGAGRGRSSRSGQAIRPSGPVPCAWPLVVTAPAARARMRAWARALSVRRGRVGVGIRPPSRVRRGPTTANLRFRAIRRYSERDGRLGGLPERRGPRNKRSVPAGVTSQDASGPNGSSGEGAGASNSTLRPVGSVFAAPARAPVPGRVELDLVELAQADANGLDELVQSIAHVELLSGARHLSWC